METQVQKLETQSTQLFDGRKEQQMQRFKSILAANMKSIRAALPGAMDEVRLCRMAANCLIRNPALLECNPASFFLAILNCAEIGLEPGIISQVALVPYNGVVQTQIMYQGMIELAQRSGRIQTIYAEVVRDGDDFEFEMGLEPKLKHVPKLDSDGEYRYAYAVAHLKDGGKQFVVMTKTQIEKIMGVSKSAKSEYSPWGQWPEEMAKKTVLKRLCKLLPKSVEMSKAIEFDGRAESDKPQTTDIIDLSDNKDLQLLADNPQNEYHEPRKPVFEPPKEQTKRGPGRPAKPVEKPVEQTQPKIEVPQALKWIDKLEAIWLERGRTREDLTKVLRSEGFITHMEDYSKCREAIAEMFVRKADHFDALFNFDQNKSKEQVELPPEQGML